MKKMKLFAAVAAIALVVAGSAFKTLPIKNYGILVEESSAGMPTGWVKFKVVNFDDVTSTSCLTTAATRCSFQFDAAGLVQPANPIANPDATAYAAYNFIPITSDLEKFVHVKTSSTGSGQSPLSLTFAYSTNIRTFDYVP